jgi:DNA (cytosine-5)-methyltransferase 1
VNWAFYNENDPFPAAWLRNLIAAGLVMRGAVDERSVAELRPADLAGARRAHFFAGIAGWDLALRLAGWPEDREVWTGSCPCQPFSGAGRRRGFADDRHLWPVWFRLIAACRPAVVLGEQVASPDGLRWLDAVCADLEDAGYACRAADLCAAGVGAPHIRQRLWWRADRLGDGLGAGLEGQPGHGVGAAGRPVAARPAAAAGGAGGLADPDRDGQRRRGGSGGETGPRDEARAEPGRCGAAGGLAHPDGGHSAAAGLQCSGQHRQQPADRSTLRGGGRGPWAGAPAGVNGPGPLHGVWRDADWLFCRDGRWRPIEPGTFPLAARVPARVGRLRAYGNAIVPQLAAAFIRMTEGGAE